jgi:hypothetical protein
VKIKQIIIFSFLLSLFFVTPSRLYSQKKDEGKKSIAPPSNVKAQDLPFDDGKILKISWKLSPDDKEIGGDLDGYQIFRATQKDTLFKEISQVKDNVDTYKDTELNPDDQYIYKVRVKKGEAFSEFSYSNYSSPKVNWFRKDRINIFILFIVFSVSLILYIRSARKGKGFFIRKISGLDAIEEAVGRATEMGKSVLYIPGIQELDEIQTIAGLSILGKVAKITAAYDTPLLVPVMYSMVMVAGQEVIKEAYFNAGKPERFKKDMVKYVAGEQFAYATAVAGIMLRERPAANIFMGAFYAESLLLAETGQSTKAIQIAGTANPDQLPFFIAACDYTIMGEELYAASAYLSKEPVMLGSLKSQDLLKILLIVCILLGVIFETLHLGNGFFTRLFIEH